MPPGYPELAARVDPARTYVLLPPSGRADQVRLQLAYVQLYARGRRGWHSTTQYIRPGQPVGDAAFPTTLTVREIRSTGTDLLVTFADANGAVETRSSNADSNDPLRRFFADLVSYGGRDLDRHLFS